MNSKTVTVGNIRCGHCVATITREVGEVQGVTSVAAEQETKQVTITWDPERTTWTTIEDLMREIDYSPTG